MVTPPVEPPPPTLCDGEVLAERYRIVSCLGQGSVGEVYEAEDLELGKRIAVKVLRPDITDDERILRRFQQEIQLARRVSHPSLCRTYDLVHHRDPRGTRVFLTLELLRGETLEERLAHRCRLTPAEALPIVRQIVAALAAAHAAGIVHRDLKSSNVFLVGTAGSGGARAVVTDFGFAWNLEQEEGSSETLTATGELIGSPAYMAPEQVRGEKATPAADVYALGVVLYEMVTGELPFLGKSAFYTALKRLQEDPPAPRALVPELDPAWESVILRCLEREPAGRFTDLGEIVRALEGGTPDAPSREPETLWWGRSTRWTSVAALLLFVLAGALALVYPRVEVGPRTEAQGTSQALMKTAQLAELAGDLPRALEGYRQALDAKCSEGEGDGRKIAALQGEIGRLELARGHLDNARAAYRAALEISSEMGDEEGIANGLAGLADIDRHAGNLASAEEAYEQALEKFRKLGIRDREADMLRALRDLRARRESRILAAKE